MKITFPQIGEFRACCLAEEWCEERGISVGRMQGGDPRGLMRGDFDIQKWRNLNDNERAALHGKMTGNMREGPVIIEMFDEPETVERKEELPV